LRVDDGAAESTFRLQREMGCTRTELIAALEAMTTAAVRAGDGAVSIAIDSGVLRIAMRERSPRRIGALALPVLDVELVFTDVSAAARDAFLRRFELYTRRGGG